MQYDRLRKEWIPEYRTSLSSKQTMYNSWQIIQASLSLLLLQSIDKYDC